MKIEKIEAYHVDLPYLESFRIALGTSEVNHATIVKLTTDENIFGWGEAAPSMRVLGETRGTILEALRIFGPKLVGVDPTRIEWVVNLLHGLLQGNTAAKASIDTAVHDITSKYANCPLWRFMGGYRDRVETDFTLGIKKPEEMARDAVRVVDKGFGTLKVKVGVNPEEDIERVKLVREAVGDKIAIRVDANQGWSVRQAIRVIEQIDRFNVEVVEQPVKAYDIEGLARVKRASPIPIMADESVHSPVDALRVIKADAVDYINIKLMKSGGLWNARNIAAIAQAADVPCMIGCMGETNVAITAGVHLAAAIKNIQLVDLDADLFQKHSLVVSGGAACSKGYRVPPDKPGLGALVLDEGLLGKPVFAYPH